MKEFYVKYVVIGLIIVSVLSLLVMSVSQYSYVQSFVGLCTLWSAWLFFGHLITIDDDMPGGWSNPDGEYPTPWKELLLKGALFLICVSILTFV